MYIIIFRTVNNEIDTWIEDDYEIANNKLKLIRLANAPYKFNPALFPMYIFKKCGLAKLVKEHKI